MIKNNLKKVLRSLLNELDFSCMNNQRNHIHETKSTQICGYNISIGVSMEGDSYIYNLFVNNEYENIRQTGAAENTIPNEVIEEMCRDIQLIVLAHSYTVDELIEN